MAEKDALSDAKVSSGLFLNEFPVKIRVLTRDPMVYNTSYNGNPSTKYAFVVFDLDHQQVMILDKGPGFLKRFKEINADEDFGGDLRKINIKISKSGSGKETRYQIDPLGSPSDLTEEQKKIIKDAKVDLEKVVKKNNPGAIRLSEVNAGKEPGAAASEQEVEPSKEVTEEDVY